MTPSARHAVAACAVSLVVLVGCGASEDASSTASPTDVAETYEPSSAAAAESVESASAAESVEPASAAESVEPAAADGGANASATEGSSADESASAAETRPEILLLDTSQVDGQPFELAAAVGNDVLLWFWAPW
ncbi:hypothetical protein [Candidatus Poriferisodalis sp.]|uniref:hypothetical protein n=1 Tax=Candidatus Poriferisodalis sp. TaxID=3101277 RepID=UPI003C6F8DA0